ncbi:MAG: hypothetical protein ACR2N2_00945, partial [Acidimicrobiia bacterium]
GKADDAGRSLSGTVLVVVVEGSGAVGSSNVPALAQPAAMTARVVKTAMAVVRMDLLGGATTTLATSVRCVASSGSRQSSGPGGLLDVVSNMTSHEATLDSPLSTGLAWAAGLSALWVLLAVLRPETTLHLGPLLIPLVPSLVMDGSRNTLRATLIAAAIALAITAILAVTGNLSGPALGPFPHALAESVVFVGVGAAVGVGVARLRRADIGQ